MPGAATITAFAGQTPPWSLVSLDANFTAMNALLKDVGNYSTYIADAGGANAYSCTYGASLTFSLATGVKVSFKAANANTGASTLNVNATGIKNILNTDGSALIANQIKAGGIYTVVYDGTQYQLLNPTQNAISGGLVLSGNLTWSTDNTWDIGASGANRARDLFLGRNAVIGGTTSFGGNVVSDLLFTDATFDIGKSGATRPRDFFASRNATIGGTLLVSGATATVGGASGGNQVIVNGGTGAGAGSQIAFQRNSVTKGIIGTDALITGSNSDDLTLYLASGNFNFYPGGAKQVQITGTASATRYLTLTGSNGGNPAIGVSAGNLALVATEVDVGTTADSANSFYVQASSTGIPKGGVNSSGFDALQMIVNNSGSTNSGIPTGCVGLATVTGHPMVFANPTEFARLTIGGYFKASNSGTYISATGAYHEFYSDGNAGTNYVINVKHAAATTANQFGIALTLAGDPNNTGQEFLRGIGNATERFTARANGGLANFSANNVNLSALSAKKDFTPLTDLPGMLDLMWEAHRELDWAQYRYKDQTHEEFNYGPSAERVHELFTKRGIPLTDAWQPTKMHTGAVTIGGLSYDYAVRGDNPDSPLGITGDFAYVTGAMVSYAQKRIERIEAALRKAKLL